MAGNITDKDLNAYLGLAATNLAADGHTSGTVNNYANLENSITSTNGIYDSNANKIWNNLGNAELQAYLGDVIGNKAITTDPITGQKYQMVPDESGNLQQVPYSGTTRRLYGYNTKDQESDAFKLGLSTGKYNTSDARYDSILGHPSGEKGVDVKRKVFDVELPYDVATKAEAVFHGNDKAREQRLVQLSDAKQRKLFGSGASEYYTSLDSVLGDVSKQDTTGLTVPAVELGAEDKLQLQPKVSSRTDSLVGLTDDQGDKVFGTGAKYGFLGKVAPDADLFSRAGNTAKAFAAGVAGSVYDIADLGTELAGAAVGKNWDLGTDEEKSKNVASILGYDTRYEQATHKAIKGEIARMDKEGVDAKGIWNVLKEGFTTPEFLGTSLGFVATLAVGGPLSAGGKAVNAASKGLKVAEATKDVAQIAKATEVLNEAKAAYTTTKQALDFVSKNAGMFSVSAGTTNDDLDTYAKNAGIKKSEIAGLKGAGVYAGNLLINSLDKWSDLGILRSPELGAGIGAIVKGMTEKQLVELGKGIAKVGQAVAVSGGKEYATEYVQTFLEQVNQQVGTQTGKTVMDAWANEDNKLERQTAGVLGLTGAQQMNTVVAAPAVAGGVMDAVRSIPEPVTRSVAQPAATTDTSTIGSSMVAQVYDIGTRLQSGEPVTIDDYNKLDAYEKQHQGATDTDIVQSLKQTAGMKKALLKKLETSTPEDIQGFMMGSKAMPTAIIEAIADFNPESRSALLAKLEQAEVISKELSTKLEKSFAEVEIDATDSLRGYKTYGAILEELSKDPETNADTIAEYKGKVANYLDTQVSYVDKMTAAINYVNKVVTSANPDAATDVKVTYDTVNGKQVVGTVKYEIPDLKQANGKPYVLTVNRTFGPSGKSIYVSPATDTILAKKNENIAALQKILDGAPGEVVSPRLQKQTATAANVPDLDEPVIEDTSTPWEEVGDETTVVTEPVVETKSTPKQEKTVTVKTKTSKITVTAVPKGDSRLGGALANRKYVQEGLTKNEVIDYVLGKGDTKTSTQKKAMVDYMKRAFGRDIVKELNSMDEQTIRKFVILHEAGHENYSDTTEAYFADTRQRIAKHLKVADAGNKYLSDSAIRTEARATEYALNELGKASFEERKSDVLPWETNEEYLTRSLAENAKDMPAESTEPVDTAVPTETKKGGTTTIGQKLRNKFNELGGAKNTLVAYAKTLAKILASTRPNDAEQIKTVINAQVAEIVGDDATRPSAVISKALGKVRASKEGKTGNDLAILNAAEKELVAELATSKEFETEERATGKQATDSLLNSGAKRKTKKGEAETKSLASILLTSTKAGMRGLLALSDEMTDKLGEQVAKMKASLAAILAKSNGLNYAWLGDSPSRLLYDNYGVAPEKVAEAMTIVSIDFMAQAAGDLSVNTREDVAKWLGIQNPATVTVKVMRDIGKLEQLLATGLGAKVLKLLGVTVPADSPASLKPRLEADLGATLLRAMVEQGILEELQVIDTNTIETLKGIGGNKKEMGAFVMPDPATLENPLTTFRLSADAKAELAKSQAVARELHKQLVKEMKEDATSTGPRTTKTSGKKVFKAKNVEDVTTVSKYTNEVLNIAENTPFTAHEAAKVLAGVFGKNRNYDDRTVEQKELLELFGYVDTAAETTEVHVDKREDVEADNRTLFRKLSYFADHIDNFGDVEVYFNYFVSKNGRLFIDSATVNPQTDKIARFILTVKTGDNVVTDKHIDTFKLGVVQAFDGSKFVMPGEADAVVVDEDGIELVDLGAIDKQSTAKSIEDFDRMMADTVVKAAVQSIQDGKPDNALIMEVIKDTKHPTHAMAALYELAKYTKANGGEFETSLVIEVDGVTSGVFLGHILNPVMSDYTKLKGALTRGGMFFGDDAGKTYGEWKELGGTDTYQVGIPVIKERLAGIEFKNHKAIQALVEINRAFMKNPLMVFFYGAGRASIKNAISDTIADEVITNLSKNDLTDAYKAKVIAVMVDKRDTHLRTAKESDKVNVKAFNANKAEQLDKAIKWLSDKNTTAKVIRNTSMAGNKGNLATVYAAVHSETHDTVAAATVDYLDKEYGEVRKAQEAMNFVFKGAFGVFKKHYDNEMVRVIRSKATVPTKATPSETGYVVKTQEQISKLTDAAVLKQLDSGALQATNADVDTVLKTLMDKGLVPGILTVDGEGVAEKAAIIKRDKTSLATEKDANGKTVAKETYKTVQLHLGNSNKQKVVNPLIYQWLANPVAGGVTNIHYFDSAMIQRIVREGSGLGVHDAWVANVTKAVAAGYTYNEAIWIASQKFDMLGDVLQQFVNLTSNRDDRNAFMAELFDKDHMDKRQDAFGELAGLTREEYKEWFMAKLQNTLVVSVNNSRINKQKLANETFALSQMAGPKGIAYSYKPAEAKEVVGNYMEWADDQDLLDSTRAGKRVKNTTKPASEFSALEKTRFANPLMRALVKGLGVKIKEKDVSGALLADTIRNYVASIIMNKNAVLSRAMIDQMYVSGAYDVDTNTILHPGKLVEVDKELQEALDEGIGKLVKEIPSLVGVDVKSSIEPEWSNALQRAVYNRKKDFKAHGRRVPIEVLLHELGHALTESFMVENHTHPVVVELEAMYQQLKPVLMKDKYFANKDTYWQKDLEEFLSEALSNPKLIKKLAAIKVNNVKDVNSVLEAIVRFVSGLFGKNENTLYDAIMFRLAQIALHEDKEAIAMAIIDASRVASGRYKAESKPVDVIISKTRKATRADIRSVTETAKLDNSRRSATEEMLLSRLTAEEVTSLQEELTCKA